MNELGAARSPGTSPGTLLCPPVATWFRRRFPHGPTGPQAAGWPAIAAGHHTLVAAPTGSGKTLAAFLMAIDRAWRAHLAGAAPAAGVRVVYVSPLRALAVDVAEHLQRPLAEIAAVAAESGLDAPDLPVGVRTGDTAPAARAAMLRRPPTFLVTTPESLFLLLTAERSRAMLRGVELVIVDEIHALAPDRRGAHLALSLERLEALCGHPPQRVGLSATQRPVEAMARLLVGDRPPPVVVDLGHRRDLDVAVELPGGEPEAVTSGEQLGAAVDRIAELVAAHRTTLVFVNTRRWAERLAHLLGERLGPEAVAAHHGSLSTRRRQAVETRLRAGGLRALVATASLELGIDVGPVELVCQVGSPRRIATFLQRVGRANHHRDGVPRGRLFPLTRDGLVECAALLAAVRAGRLDAIAVPEGPLDVLAQQVVAEVAAGERHVDELYALVRRAAPYAGVRRETFDEVVELTSRGVETGRGRRGAHLHHDPTTGTLRPRRGARLAACTSGGTIPETGDYRVLAEPDETFIGTVNEDWAVESMAGDVFLLGTHSWQVRRVEAGVVRVRDAGDLPPTIPFWLGEAPARSDELSEEVSALRELVESHLAGAAGRDGAVRAVADRCGITVEQARHVVDYLAAARAVLGALPTRRRLVLERVFDEAGGMQLVVHSPYGARVNRALGLVLRKRFCRTFNFELQAAATDDAVVVSLGPHHSFPLADVPRFLGPAGVLDTLRQAILPAPMFLARWRWNLNRALVVLRFRGGRRHPPPLQRMEADDVMAAVFPQAAACQENVTGPVEIPDHPLVRQTVADTLGEALDAAGFVALVEDLAAGRVEVRCVEPTEPSLLAHEILNAAPYAFLDGEGEVQNRRSRAVPLRRGLPVDLAGIGALDPDVVAEVTAELAPTPDGPDELAELLATLVLCPPRPEWAGVFAELARTGRGREVRDGGRCWWAVLDAGDRPDAALAGDPEALGALVRAHLEVVGIATVEELAGITRLPAGALRVGLAAAERTGAVLGGRYRPGPGDDGRDDVRGDGGGDGPPEWVARRVLARMHARSRRDRRARVRPVSPAAYLAFLTRWQHVAPDARLVAEAGLERVLDRLVGWEAPAGAWEPDLLARRLVGYEPALLDRLGHEGQLTWLRLAPPARPAAGPASRPGLGAGPSRATPVSLVWREDLPWLLAAARPDGPPSAPGAGPLAEILEVLDERGPCFAAELAEATRRLPDDIARGLWDGVARGLLTADGFGALRARIAPRRAGRGRAARLTARRRWGPVPVPPAPGAGRWARVPAPAFGGDPEELAELVADLLLRRWGVVFRALLGAEALRLPWVEVCRALRRFEDRGLVLGGRFVAGIGGEQFALPEAAEELRRAAGSDSRTAGAGTGSVRISATDPCNLVGLLGLGPTVPALRTRTVEVPIPTAPSSGHRAAS
jgi:ATP-dependent Lhr-like helicase